MSGRRRTTLSPSLFPFLAVLVCTLGTLILFLALVAQKAEQTAQDAVDNPEAPESVSSLVTEQQWKRERYVAIRESQTTDLQQRSSELTHIEDHVRRLREKLQQLQSETVVATASEFDEQAKHQEIVLLKQKIDAENERVVQLSHELSSRRPRVVIVPHHGPNGTDQRPIYVECTADGLVLQPEGAFISKLQLEGPAGTGNPLDAALRTIRYHWQQTDPDGPAPYPLLVVRPDGIETYAAARSAMQGWDDQFGYELVPGEIELAFPRPDTTLRERVDVAIREAVTRQHARLAASSYSRTRQALGGGRPRMLSAADLARNDSRAGSGERYFARPLTSDTASRHGSIAGNDIRDFDDALRNTAGDPGRLNATALGSANARPFASAQNNSMEMGSPTANPLSASATDVAGSLDELMAAEGTMAEGIGREDTQGRLDGNSVGASTPDQNAVGATGGGRQTSTGDAGQNAPSQPNPYAQPGAASAAAQSTPSQPSQPPAKTLQRGGQDWALPASARNRGTTIVRGVHVVCLQDAFVLLPERSGGAAQRFAFTDGFVDRAAMELATAVHHRVDGWGFAIAGGRWQPVLRVQVDRNTEPRYRQLRTLLQGSGLEMEKR